MFEKLKERFKWFKLTSDNKIGKATVKHQLIDIAQNGTIDYEYIKNIYTNIINTPEMMDRLKGVNESVYLIPHKQTCGFHIGSLERDRIRVMISLICMFGDNVIKVEATKLVPTEMGDQQIYFSYEFKNKLNIESCTSANFTDQKNRMISSIIKVINRGFVNTIKLCW